MFMKKKKAFIVFVALMTMLIFICLPVFGAKKDVKNPPDDGDGQVPTFTGTVSH